MALVDSQSSACQDAALVPGQAPAKTRVGGAARGGISARSRRDTPCRQGCGPLSGCCIKLVKKRVCTMCTPWASDRVVRVPDGAGLRRFAGEWRKFKGWNPVRVPPRAQCDLRSAALWGAKCGQKYATVRSDATGQAGDTPGARPRSPMPWDSQVSESSTEPTNVESADEPPCSPCIASRLCRDRADRGRRRPATHRLVDKIAPLLAGVCAARAQSRRSKSDSDSTCTVVASRWQRLSSSSLRSVHRPPEDESAKQRVDAPG